MLVPAIKQGCKCIPCTGCKGKGTVEFYWEMDESIGQMVRREHPVRVEVCAWCRGRKIESRRCDMHTRPEEYREAYGEHDAADAKLTEMQEEREI